MKYLVIFEPTSTGYGAYSPDLPGCVAAGETLEETQALMKEAMEIHLDGLMEDGLPMPSPQSRFVLMDIELHQ